MTKYVLVSSSDSASSPALARRLLDSWHAKRLRALPLSLYVASPLSPLATNRKKNADNYPQPGKRPLSSTAPTIIEDSSGALWAVVGGSGGSRIFPALLQTLVNLDWGLDVSGAVEFGRVHDQLFPAVVDADNVYPAALLDGLRTRGHNVSIADVNRVAAVVQLVTQEGGTLYGACFVTRVF